MLFPSSVLNTCTLSHVATLHMHRILISFDWSPPADTPPLTALYVRKGTQPTTGDKSKCSLPNVLAHFFFFFFFFLENPQSQINDVQSKKNLSILSKECRPTSWSALFAIPYAVTLTCLTRGNIALSCLW